LSKKNDDDEGLKPGAGKNKRKKNKKQHVQEDPKLTLTIETLNFFDSIKVAPPTFLKDIDASIEKLNEKKEYFVKLSDELNEKPEAQDQQNSTEKPEGAKDEKTDDAPEEKSEKKEEKPKQKKEKIDLDNEDMFPSM